MTISEIARRLGRRGGLRRAKRLSYQRLTEIARMGARARAESLRLARAIRNNFDYVSAIHQLHPPAEVRSEPVCSGTLPESMTTRPRSRTGPRQTDFIAAVGELLKDLGPLEMEPTLVGGMALVTLGSPRVTRDFDFLVAEEAREQRALVRVFYRHDFELVSGTDEQGNVIHTIDTQKVALARLRIDRPKSAYFYNRMLGLRVDLLFDFPIRAREVHERSTRRTIQSYSFHIASKDDLIRMKEIAARDRGLSGDLQDLEFLKKL